MVLETVSSSTSSHRRRDIPSSDVWGENELTDDELTDDFAGTFVKGDNDEVLAHLTLVSGPCLRSRNLGPLGRSLLEDRESDFSHASVPEFGTLWSSMPLTAFLAKVSGKLLMLLLVISFTYAVSKVRDILGLPDKRFVAAEMAILDVVTDPRDKHLGEMANDKVWAMVWF